MGSLKSCCCGCASLKTGTIIIGALGVLLNLLALILFLSATKKTDGGNAEFHFSDDVHADVPVPPVIGSIIFSFLIAVLLIVGAVLKNKWLLLPWIICSVLSVVLVIILTIIIIAGFSAVLPAGSILLMIIVAAAIIGLDIYVITVVTSHFNELRGTNGTYDSENTGQIFSSPSPRYIVLENERVVNL